MKRRSIVLRLASKGYECTLCGASNHEKQYHRRAVALKNVDTMRRAELRRGKRSSSAATVDSAAEKEAIDIPVSLTGSEQITWPLATQLDFPARRRVLRVLLHRAISHSSTPSLLLPILLHLFPSLLDRVDICSCSEQRYPCTLRIRVSLRPPPLPCPLRGQSQLEKARVLATTLRRPRNPQS